MKTIAELINWDFGANGVLEIKNKNGNRIYFELADGFWNKYEYDSKGNQIYFENMIGFWEKREYDSQNNRIYLENSIGFWEKTEYDSEGCLIYLQNSSGSSAIKYNRPKPSEDSVVEIDGVKHKPIKL